MNGFFKKNKRALLVLVAIGLLSIGGALAIDLSNFNEGNQLAQILSVEINLLKTWQRSSGLTNNIAYNSKGKEVVLLQGMLSQDLEIYPEKKVTGYYGKLTKSAVLRFQKKHKLPKTGMVDNVTKEKLNKNFLSFLCPEPKVTYPDFFFRKITKTSQALPEDYTPPSLKEISGSVKTIGVNCLRSNVLPYLEKMFNGAQKDGVYLAVTSGYRGHKIQKYLYDYWLRRFGSYALSVVALPGKSEHQLGTTVDLTDASVGYKGVSPRFARGVGAKWLIKHAYEYGFIMSYPEGSRRKTGYRYEPWHWRYVGSKMSNFLHKQGLTFNEALTAKPKPFPRKDLKKGLKLSALAAISVFTGMDGKEHFLIEKNIHKALPIASITKLMTALVASDIYKGDDTVKMSETSLSGKGISGYYSPGDTFFFKDALYALLLASHNEIASAMSEREGVDNFVRLMNKKAVLLGMANTHFFNPTGLDPKAGSDEINQSTVFDIYKLLKYISENRDDIYSILGKKEYRLTDISGNLKVDLHSTDKLLSDGSAVLSVLGGKTGETPRAKTNLAVVSKAPSVGRVVSVVLGSPNNFSDMRNLLKYIKNSFVWQSPSVFPKSDFSE